MSDPADNPKRKRNKAKAAEWHRRWRNLPGNKERLRINHDKWRRDNLERRRANRRLWTRNNPARSLWHNAKARAKLYGIEFTISVSDIELLNVCPVLGIPIFYGLDRQTANSPTLDRIDNSKGYVTGNVIVMSWRANDIKNSGTADEHDKIAQYMRNNGCV